jgi:hypothetical protein
MIIENFFNSLASMIGLRSLAAVRKPIVPSHGALDGKGNVLDED